MYTWLPALIIAFVFVACTSGPSSQDEALLSRPPYDRLTDSIKGDAGNAALYFRRGTLLYGNEETGLAEKDLRRAWQLQPKEEYGLRLALLLKQKNADTAITFLEQAVRQLPQSISLQVLLAKGYESKTETEKALAICDGLLRNYPGELDALVLKAELLRQQNKNREALSVLETAYTYAPGDVELVHQLAFTYADMKNPRALSLSDSLIKADVEHRHPEPWYFKGLYYENTGRYEEAIKDFDEAIRRDFNFLDAYLDKGETYYIQAKYAQALSAFRLAATVFPSEAEPYLWLAKTQQAMGNASEARLNYQRAYGLDKTLTEAKDSADHLK